MGFLSVLTDDQKAKERVASQCKNHIRGNYSNPPLNGARIVKTILSDDSLKKEWIEELATMRERILEMRKALSSGLQAKSQKQKLSIHHSAGRNVFVHWTRRRPGAKIAARARHLHAQKRSA